MPRTCSKCGSEGPFYENHSPSHCKACCQANAQRFRESNPAYSVRWKQANRERVRDYTLSGYGITSAEYEELLANQGGGCAICADRPETALCVDHCHASGDVRGLLCAKCNWGLGWFRDSPEFLAQAIVYLQAPPAQGHLTLRAA